MFILAPIFKNKKNIGVIALQISVDQIDKVMTNYNQWTDIGMGKTGETVLIGDDLYLRSNARSFIENPERFLAALKDLGHSPDSISEIQHENSTICNLKFDSKVAREALTGRSKEHIIAKGFLNFDALVAYTPLDIPGIKWGMISKIHKDEAFAPINKLRNILLILGFILTMLVFGVGVLFARSISNPLNKIINSLSATSTQIASTIEEHERIASQQSASVNETTTTMDELGASSRQSAEQAEASAVGARQAYELANQGQSTVSEMKDNMMTMREKIVAIAEQILNLSEQTSQIATVTNLVSDFANETKMLAMNAAVEAVRAGEFGKGFSVVAMEIRKLADQSKGSTERINALVSDIQKSTNSTVMVTEEGSRAVENVVKQVTVTEETFNEIVASINSSTESSQQISLNVKQQAAAIKQIVEAMNTLNTGAKETANGIAQTKQGVQNLDEAAQTLKLMV
ncbi:MAG: methyl-accepting chemotaxis protein [Nitrospirae bacterium]|nr:methyl-accepting chemotaxis protein [Nitrospirota bacterium]